MTNQTPQSTFDEKLRTIILRTINDSKTGVIDLKDDNGLDGADWAVKDITSLVLEELPKKKIRKLYPLKSSTDFFQDGKDVGYNEALKDVRSIITKENKL